MKNKSVTTAIALAISLIFSAIALAQEQVPAIDKLVSELAEKPEQHAAVAKYYREKAAEAKKELERHQAMRKAYSTTSFNPKNPGNSNTSMLAHCDRLIKAYESEVQAYEQMAAEHENYKN